MVLNIRSKLPHVGTTIFTVMTNRARELGAINLAQGFPDFDSPAKLKDLVAQYVTSGHNQYAPMIGVAELREQIALKMAASYGRKPDPESEITMTLGATEAIFSAVSALVHAGDDVILFDPSYDSYAPAVILAGGRPIHIPLQPPHFAIDWQRVREAVTPRLRLVMINTPHNPTGSVLSTADLDSLADILRPTEAMVLSDEVYEHMVYDGERHVSIAGHAELYARGVACFSFGKTMHATGWRVGYAIAPPELTREIRRVHQFNTFSIATPLQLAIAEFLSSNRNTAMSSAHSTSANGICSSGGCAVPASPGRPHRAHTFSCWISVRSPTCPTRSSLRSCCSRPVSHRSRSRRSISLRRTFVSCGSVSPRRTRRWRKQQRDCGMTESWYERGRSASHAGAGGPCLARRRREPARFDDLTASLAGHTDLVVLPEMFTTGFTMAAEQVAEPADGPTTPGCMGRRSG